jgi:hypothetical protein
LNSSTGVISGTPTAAGTTSATYLVTDSASVTANKALSITINAALAVSTASLPSGTVGSSYSQTLAATGGSGTYTWSITSGSLPSGLSLNSSTGAITGTPSAAATASFTVQVADGIGTVSKALSITINPSTLTISTSSLAAGNVNTAYSQTLGASGGTSPYTWSLSSGSLPAGLSLNSSTGVISGTPTGASTVSATYLVTDSASVTANKTLSITINAALAVSTASLASGTVGSSYSQTLAATGGSGTYTWSITSGSLPTGLSLASSTGVISGTPSAAATASFTVRVADGIGTATQDLTITVENDSSNPSQTGGGGGGGSGGGGGGGGGGGMPAGLTSLTNSMNIGGVITTDVHARDISSQVEVFIPQGTVVKDSMDDLISYVRVLLIDNVPASNADWTMIGPTADIELSGTTFNPNAYLIFHYSDNALPEGIPATNLFIALWNQDTMTWTDLGGTVDTTAHTVTTPIKHLSIYTLMAGARPADISISDISLTSDEINPGETITASVSVNNNGDLPGDYTLSFKLDNTEVQSKRITVNGDSGETVSFPITLDTVGEHQISIGDKFATFTVKKPLSPATFSISALNINPLTINPGENIEISAIVTNTGELAGSYTVTLSVDDITTETREINLNGGQSTTVAFSYTTGTVGNYKVTINTLSGSFQVKEAAPVNQPVANEELKPQLDSFSIAPIYDQATKKLIFARIVYQMNEAWNSLTDVKLILTVSRDSLILEQVPLLTLSQEGADSKTGQLNYVPSSSWETGEYSFKAELYQGDSLIQDMPLSTLSVTPESISAVVSWKILGITIGSVLLLGILVVTLVLYRRRNTLRDYWN